jgi:tRNA(Ile)-lysidine synthase
MVLLDALGRAGFINLVVCHLDHRLRGRASAGDARFVAAEARRRGCALERAAADTRSYAEAAGVSIELAARELRRAFFEECGRRLRCRRIVLAHHADDQVETCLFNFLRGTGAAGLGGMRPVASMGRLEVRRPLLTVGRAEIDDYRLRHRVRHREDATNANHEATRNRLRHVVVPAIDEAVGGGWREAVLRAAAILRAEHEWMESMLPEAGVELAVRDLEAMHPAARARAVLAWLRGRGVPGCGWRETQAVLGLLDKARGPSKTNLPGGWHARRRAGVVFLEAPTG